MSASSILPEKKNLEKLIEELNSQDKTLNFGLSQKGDTYCLVDYAGNSKVTNYEPADILAKILEAMIEFWSQS